MKKAILISVLMLSGMQAFAANEQFPCAKYIEKIISENGARSDYPPDYQYLGELMIDATYEPAGPYKEPMYLFSNEGSFYSGSFSELIVVTKSCHFNEKFMIYSE